MEFIRKLRPISYNVNAHALAGYFHEDRSQVADSRTLNSRDHKSRIRYSGFVAQEVESAATEVGYDFSGVDVPGSATDLYGLRYAEFVVPLVKAVQEQQQMIESQAGLIQELQSELQKLKDAMSSIAAAEDNTVIDNRSH